MPKKPPAGGLSKGAATLRVLLVFTWVSLPLSATQPSGDSNPLFQHMERTLTGNESQWRAPNPDHQGNAEQPFEFGLRFRMEPDNRHATGELTGRFRDGREVIYWSLLTFYNPVTEKVIVQQIGWDGALMRGEIPVQTGKRQTIDMTMYAPSGAMQRSRHQMHFVNADEHTADAYQYGPDGSWQLQQSWRWKRTPTPGAKPEQAVPAVQPAIPSKLTPYVQHLLAGSGQWRADSPLFEEGKPRQFGMNYRWGPNRQFVIAEIVSLYADGRREKDWSLYITYNPVTGIAALEQTGEVGLYFRGEMSHGPNDEHIESGLIYFPNGTVKSVRDKNRMLDPNSRQARVFERNEQGGWKMVREWTWKQLEG